MTGLVTPIQRYAKQKGLAMVEFAIAMPVVLTLLAAAGEIGKLVHDQSVLVSGIMDGGRYLTVKTDGGLINDDIKTATKNVLIYGDANANGSGPARLDGLVGANITITCGTAQVAVAAGTSRCLSDTATGYASLRIDVSYTYKFMFGSLLSNLIGSSFSTIEINKSILVPVVS